jgi:hypothetical protein
LLDSTVLLPTDLDGAPVIDVRRGRWLGVLHPNSQKNIISLPTRKP